MTNKSTDIISSMPDLLNFCLTNNIAITCMGYAEDPTHLNFEFAFHTGGRRYYRYKVRKPKSTVALRTVETYLLGKITSVFNYETEKCLFEQKKIMLRSVLGNKSDPIPEIKKVIFNEPATIVFWEDGTKTIVKYGKEDAVFDPEKGLAMAIAKKALGNTGRYYEMFKKWLPEED